MLCPVLCRQSQRIKQLTLVNKTNGLGNLYVTRCSPTQIIRICLYTWNGLFQWSYVWVYKKEFLFVKDKNKEFFMILIKEKLRMMLRLYKIKICYARILMCKFAFLFPQKRGMKISPSNNQWNVQGACVVQFHVVVWGAWANERLSKYYCSPGIVLSMRFIIYHAYQGNSPFYANDERRKGLKHEVIKRTSCSKLKVSKLFYQFW